jgi:hypothetical protein
LLCDFKALCGVEVGFMKVNYDFKALCGVESGFMKAGLYLYYYVMLRVDLQWLAFILGHSVVRLMQKDQ